MARDYNKVKIKVWQRAEELVPLVFARDFQKSEIELIPYIREV